MIMRDARGDHYLIAETREGLHAFPIAIYPQHRGPVLEASSDVRIAQAIAHSAGHGGDRAAFSTLLAAQLQGMGLAGAQAFIARILTGEMGSLSSDQFAEIKNFVDTGAGIDLLKGAAIATGLGVASQALMASWGVDDESPTAEQLAHHFAGQLIGPLQAHLQSVITEASGLASPGSPVSVEDRINQFICGPTSSATLLAERMGDKDSKGNAIVTGASTVMCESLPLAQEGSTVEGKGVRVFTGAETVETEGKRTARQDGMSAEGPFATFARTVLIGKHAGGDLPPPPEQSPAPAAASETSGAAGSASSGASESESPESGDKTESPQSEAKPMLSKEDRAKLDDLDREYDALIFEADQETDPQRQQELMAKADRVNEEYMRTLGEHDTFERVDPNTGRLGSHGGPDPRYELDPSQDPTASGPAAEQTEGSGSEAARSGISESSDKPDSDPRDNDPYINVRKGRVGTSSKDEDTIGEGGGFRVYDRDEASIEGNNRSGQQRQTFGIGVENNNGDRIELSARESVEFENGKASAEVRVGPRFEGRLSGGGAVITEGGVRFTTSKSNNIVDYVIKVDPRTGQREVGYRVHIGVRGRGWFFEFRVKSADPSSE
jgi:uncharacterized Zn-binding protein involved in type VI secretion